MKNKFISIFSLNIVFIILFSNFIIAQNLTNKQKEDLYKKIPHEINKLNEFEIVYEVLDHLDDENLPKYNGENSKELFRRIFNKEFSNSVFNSESTGQDKRELLAKMSLLYSKFANLFLIKKIGMYDNETARISILSTYSTILALELLDNEIIKEGVSFPNEKALFLVKMIGRDF